MSNDILDISTFTTVELQDALDAVTNVEVDDLANYESWQSVIQRYLISDGDSFQSFQRHMLLQINDKLECIFLLIVCVSCFTCMVLSAKKNRTVIVQATEERDNAPTAKV